MVQSVVISGWLIHFLVLRGLAPAGNGLLKAYTVIRYFGISYAYELNALMAFQLLEVDSEGRDLCK